MGRVRVEVKATLRYREVDLDKLPPAEIAKRIEDQVKASLRGEQAEVNLTVTAEPG